MGGAKQNEQEAAALCEHSKTEEDVSWWSFCLTLSHTHSVTHTLSHTHFTHLSRRAGLNRNLTHHAHTCGWYTCVTPLSHLLHDRK